MRSWLLHHDNAPAHNAVGIRSLLPKITLLYWSNHPTLQIWPFVTSFLFPKLKEVIKGTRFQDSEAIKTRELRAILPRVRGSMAEEIGKVHSSLRRLL